MGVNCSGFTNSNYTQLTELYSTYKDKGTVFLFSCWGFMFLDPKFVYFQWPITFELGWIEGPERNIFNYSYLRVFCWLISGFEILAFPCNQFLKQEPGNSEEAEQFACTRYKAEYPIFGKVCMMLVVCVRLYCLILCPRFFNRKTIHWFFGLLF